MGACAGLVRLAMADAGVLSQLARLILWFALSGLRFAQFQRSQYQGMSDRLVLGLCARG